MEKRTEKMSKWRNVFHHIEVQLTATDTSLRRWKADGPTHYLTINRLIKLIPQNTTSNYFSLFLKKVYFGLFEIVVSLVVAEGRIVT